MIFTGIFKCKLIRQYTGDRAVLEVLVFFVFCCIHGLVFFGVYQVVIECVCRCCVWNVFECQLKSTSLTKVALSVIWNLWGGDHINL